MHLTTLSFPDIPLRQSDGHKLRGYFAKLFGEESDLFHNHNEAGQSIYRYPSIQFKVINNTAHLIGLGDGARLLIERFTKIKELNLDNRKYLLTHKNISSTEVTLGTLDDLNTYQFCTPWMALNQKNHETYLSSNPAAQKTLLKRILIGNILSFMKAQDCMITDQILVAPTLSPIKTKFKNRTMMAFNGSFTSNAYLPNYIGLGKSVARGYGAIQHLN